MAVKKPTLTEYVASKQPPPCWLCTIPEREEVDEAKRAGVPARLVRDWLIEVVGYAENLVTMSKMDKHIQGRHYETIK